MLELLSLNDRAREVVGTLSGGLRRRVTMARALLHEPELLIIDEPTLGVDAEARHAIWAHVRLIRAGGTTIVVATNYLDEAQAFCDTAAVLRGGRLVAYESPESLVARAGQCIDVQCEPSALPAIDEDQPQHLDVHVRHAGPDQESQHHSTDRDQLPTASFSRHYNSASWSDSSWPAWQHPPCSPAASCAASNQWNCSARSN